MPPGARWSWLEAYGLLQADPVEVHQADWSRARQAVEQSLERLIPRSALEMYFKRSAAWIDLPITELVQRGSGWGALERLRRQQAGEAPFHTPGLVFGDDSLGEEQAPWLALLQQHSFPALPPAQPPRGWLVQAEWQPLLDPSLENQPDNWAAWLYVGMIHFQTGEVEAARNAWRRSLECTRTPWALRSLAVLESQAGEVKLAADYLLEARRLTPQELALAVECGRALLAAGRYADWLALLPELPESVRSAGRVRLLVAQAALQGNDLDRLETFFAQPFILPDLREGETSLSDLWFAYHEQRLSQQEGCPVDAALRQRVQCEYPLPAHLDFRMSSDL